MNHKNQVRIDDRTQTMGNYETCLAMHQLLSCGLNPLLSQGIHIGCGLIKDDHGFIRQHGSGNRDQLPLSFGEIDPIIGNQGIIALLCALNEMMDMHFFRNTFHIFLGHMFVSINQIVVDRSIKQP